MDKPYIFAYDTNDQTISIIEKLISFSKMDIVSGFVKVDNTKFICNKNCSIFINLRIMCVLLNDKSTICCRTTKNDKEIIGSQIVTTITNSQSINISFPIILNENDIIKFHIISDNDNSRIGAMSFNNNDNLPKTNTPISATLTIISI